MKKISTCLLIVVSIFTINSCRVPQESENCHRRIFVKNNSELEIKMTVISTYPDSLNYFGPIRNNENIAGPNGGIAEYEDYYSCFEGSIPVGNKYGVKMIYLFDTDVIKHNSTKDIIEKRLYLKKYDMTVEKLQEINWTIVYPSEE